MQHYCHQEVSFPGDLKTSKHISDLVCENSLMCLKAENPLSALFHLGYSCFLVTVKMVYFTAVDAGLQKINVAWMKVRCTAGYGR